MRITLAEAHDIPENAYISIRAGDVRCQKRFAPGEILDLPGSHRHFCVDIFEKIGSKQVSLADLRQASGDVDQAGRVENGEANTMLTLEGSGPECINFERSDGSAMKLGLRVAVAEDPSIAEKIGRSPSRHQAALEVSSYLDRHALQKVLQTMVHLLIKTQPNDPVTFMTEYLQESKSGIQRNETSAENDRSSIDSAVEAELLGIQTNATSCATPPVSSQCRNEAKSAVSSLGACLPTEVPDKSLTSDTDSPDASLTPDTDSPGTAKAKYGKGVPPGKPPPGKGEPPGKAPGGKGVPPGKPPPGKGVPPAKGMPPGKPPPGKPPGKAPPAKPAPSKAAGPFLSLEEQLAQKRNKLRAVTPPSADTPAEKIEADPAVEASKREHLLSDLKCLAVNTTLGVVVADSVRQQDAEVEDGLRPLIGGAAASHLGQGRFASVVQAVVPVDTPGQPLMPVAAKRFAVSPAAAKDKPSVAAVPLSALQSALREAEALSVIGPHPNIVRLLGIVLPASEAAGIPAQEQPMTTHPPLQLLLRPSMASLHRLVTSAPAWESLHRYGQLVLLVDAARGILAMHSAGFAHLDIKSHNVLVDRQADGTWAACICDLGSAYRIHDDGAPPPAEGTAGWTAPEILDESPEHLRVKTDARLADLFSFGVLIWEVVSGPGSSHPLNHLAGDEYVAALASGRRPLFASSVENFDESLLAAECWQFEATARPSIFKVVDRLMHRIAVLKNNMARTEREQE